MAVTPIASGARSSPSYASAPIEGIDIGEYMEVAPDPDHVTLIDAPGGGAYVDMPGDEEESTPPDSGFYANLAQVIPSMVQQRIITDLMRKIDDDKQSREPRDKQYEEGLRRTGMGNDAPGGAEFEGASRAVHPVMLEACIDYEARIIKEIFPPSGPVKPKILGEPSDEKTARAKRITEHMNYQITTQIKEARSVLEKTLTQVPLGGSQFIHIWQDHRLKRIRWEFRAVDKFYIPSNAADFASAQRKTYHDKITAIEYKHRVDAGDYVDIDTPPPAQIDEPTKAEKANMKIEGKDESHENLDGERDIYETMTFLEVTEDMEGILDVEAAGSLYPYMITMDVSSKKMLAMYRCWEDGDQRHEPIEHDFEFPFIPWRGALSIGFPQIIGGLSAAATGALRALLDSALISTSPGGLILKGSGANAQTLRPQIGALTEFDGGMEAKDIRERVMQFSVTQPSPVLFELLGFVVNAAKEIVRTSLDETPVQGGTNVPVGTQLSRVEEGLVVFSAIHGRAHAAMDRLLAGMFRLNRLYLPEELREDDNGREIMVRRKDYEGASVVQPVSDPTIYSDQQRFAQIAWIQDRMMKVPGLYKVREVELAALKLIKWPNPEEILADVPQPHELNQVNENLAMVMGKPVEVFADQDHLAHLVTLCGFMQSPMLGMNPVVAPLFLPAAVKHAGQHIAYLYVEMTAAQVQQATEGVGPADLMSNDPTLKYKFDGLLAKASALTLPLLAERLTALMPVIQQAMAAVKQMMPPPPMDPAMAAVQAAAAETSRKGAADQANTQVNQGKLALQQQENAIAADRVSAMREGQQLQAQTKLETTQQDNSTAEEIASQRTNMGAPPGFTNGESLSH